MMESKYLEFEFLEQKPKTQVWAVNTKEQEMLGVIKWFPQWRQYTFFPEPEMVFSLGCMNDICSFIMELKSKM